MKIQITFLSTPDPNAEQGMKLEHIMTSAELRALARELTALADGTTAQPAIGMRVSLGMVVYAREEAKLVELVPAGTVRQ